MSVSAVEAKVDTRCWCDENTWALSPRLFVTLIELYSAHEIPYSDYDALVGPNPCEFKLQILVDVISTLRLAGKVDAVNKLLQAITC